MFASAVTLAASLNSRLPSLIASLENTSNAAGVTMKGANNAIERFAGPNSPLRSEAIKTLIEVSSAARSIRVLAQYLESHPEALIKGKGK
jgi:paraquat-inducible protein B